MSNQIRGFAKVIFTPAGGGSAVTFTGRNGGITPENETIPITSIDETNHQIQEDDIEIIKAKTTFEVLDIHSVDKALVDAMFGNNAAHTLGLSIAKGTAVVTWHDRKDLAATPFIAFASFTCRIEIDKLEIGIEEVKAAAMKIITMGATRPTYKVRGVPA